MTIIKKLPAYLALVVALVLVGCNTTADEPLATAPSKPVTVAGNLEANYIPNTEMGRQAWLEQQCDDCHGPIGMGGIGPKLADTAMSFDSFLVTVRTAILPKPAYPAEVLPGERVYDIYAWLRAQQNQPVAPAPTTSTTELPSFGGETPSIEDAMGMTIWSYGGCSVCHGVFAQGGKDAPPLAGINYPVEEELSRMRQTASEITEHAADNISDDVFAELYRWLQAGCTYTEDCNQ